MAIFPELAAAGQDGPLPLFRELAVEPDTLEPIVGADGAPVYVEGADAVAVWVRKALHAQSERFAYAAYTGRYGNELRAMLASGGFDESRAMRAVRDALLVNPYILAVEGLTASHEGSCLTVTFTLKTVYQNSFVESRLHYE